jgi:hypothetical protein
MIAISTSPYSSDFMIYLNCVSKTFCKAYMHYFLFLKIIESTTQGKFSLQ